MKKAIKEIFIITKSRNCETTKKAMKIFVSFRFVLYGHFVRVFVIVFNRLRRKTMQLAAGLYDFGEFRSLLRFRA